MTRSISSKEFGYFLFDFCFKQFKDFLENKFQLHNKFSAAPLATDDTLLLELLACYSWLGFHCLNIMGRGYETSAMHFHTKLLHVLKVSDDKKDEMMAFLQQRYEEYQKEFSTLKNNSDFLAVAIASTPHILNGKQAPFFSAELGLHMSRSLEAMLMLFKNIQLVNE